MKDILFKNREPENNKNDLFVTADTTEIHADGIGPIMLGIPNSKLGIFQLRLVPDETPDIEQREVVQLISVPTGSLIEFCVTFLKIVEANRGNLNEAVAKLSEVISAVSSKSLGNIKTPVDTQLAKEAGTTGP